ncbi:MAG: glycine cleavage system aminomethyltransferase GcvT [Deltaproteobacteria bacterium]|nr:glycine cleavage system aminomethyltransferase GcvT [Deltaproteobacteria bacterium]
MSEDLKRTPLYENHLALKGKMVPFAGWEMPVQYSGLLAEHEAVRTKAGLFDVSHMGEVWVEGKEAEKMLNYLTCNDVSKLVDGKAQYTAITKSDGTLIDDIIIYRMNSEKFLVCVNASNADKDFDWFCKHNKFDATCRNESDQYGQIAIQGPAAISILEKYTGEEFAESLQFFHHRYVSLAGTDVLVARTGYTGEDGAELFIPKNSVATIWDELLVAGASQGLVPCGLGARDTLRLEACLPLYGHELSEEVSAIESGISPFVKVDKESDFLGKEILTKHKNEGAPRALVGFYVDSPGIVREGCNVFSEAGQRIGFTTSGTKSPTLGKALGLAVIDSDYKKPNTKLLIEVRGRQLECHVVKRPFYRRAK